MVSDFQSEILKEEWESRQKFVLAKSNQRILAEEQRKQDLEKKLSAWKEQDTRVHERLDERLDELKTQFSEAEVEVRHDASRIQSKIGQGPKVRYILYLLSDSMCNYNHVFVCELFTPTGTKFCCTAINRTHILVSDWKRERMHRPTCQSIVLFQERHQEYTPCVRSILGCIGKLRTKSNYKQLNIRRYCGLLTVGMRH
jgi:hypothetical protein